ncbi:hypothetical protein BJ944DRAFT_258747 [Cunninghamella echinulata]|nr:hypothetical protein BJ944DRAFT_258747 [Cunninghamella echinulata]
MEIICFVEEEEKHESLKVTFYLKLIYKNGTIDEYIDYLTKNMYKNSAFLIYDNDSKSTESLNVINIFDKRMFRCAFYATESIASNLMVRNVDFEEFCEVADDNNGVFRKKPEEVW